MPQPTRPTVVTISGLDPAGCAGLHADIRAIESLGCHAASVATTLTIQNTLGAFGTQNVSPAHIALQLNAICEDLNVRAIKIGMVTQVSLANAICEKLQEVPAFTVLDPVGAPSKGAIKAKPASLQDRYGPLLTHVDLVTPNAQEAAQLVGSPIANIHDARLAGEKLVATGFKAVLIKGGHFENPHERGADILVTPARIEIFQDKPVVSPHSRGTGCVLSSAIAAAHARGHSLRDCIHVAKRVVRSARLGGFKVGTGPGPILTRPYFENETSTTVGRLHVITSETLQTKWTHQELAQAAAKGGAHVVQYREKRNLTSQEHLKNIRAMGEALLHSPCQLVVNDRSDLANATGSALHIGPNDVEPVTARAIVGPSAIIGATANNLEMLKRLEHAPIDYVGVGPIFKTSSKKNAPPCLGIEGLREMVEYSPVPVIAIGGVLPEHVEAILRAGAHGVAVIAGVVLQDNVEQATQEYRRAMNRMLETTP